MIQVWHLEKTFSEVFCFQALKSVSPYVLLPGLAFEHAYAGRITLCANCVRVFFENIVLNGGAGEDHTFTVEVAPEFTRRREVKDEESTA